MEEFSALDSILMLSGSRIHCPNRVCRVANIAFIPLIMASYISTCWIHISVIKILRAEPLTLGMFLADAVFGTIFLLAMNLQRKQFVTIFSQTGFLSQSQRKKLRKHSLVGIILVLLCYTLSVTNLVIHLRSVTAWSHIVIDVSRTYMIANSWFVGGSFVYAYFVKLVRAREESFFQQLLHSLSSKKITEQETIGMIIARKRVTEFKESITSSFSIIPCLWYGFIFVKIGMVYENMAYAEYPAMVVIRYGEIVMLLLLLVYVINLCESVTDYTKRMTKDVITRIITSGRTAPMADLVSELRESSEFSFTVCSMFEINRKFALSFLSSLITFTVLLIQIAFASKGKQKQ